MQAIIFSAIAGICGTGLGGVVSAVFMRRSSERVACWMLSFAAGVMTSIVCFGLLPEAVDLTNIVIAVIGLVAGIIIIMPLNRIIDRITESKGDHPKLHTTHEELYHESKLIKNRSRMVQSGFIMFAAIGLHNIPEGLAIGAGGSHDYQLGLLLAIMIALHNIPEGMAIATPMLAGGMRKVVVVLLAALSGAPTLLGGVIGSLIGGISDTAIALSLAAAGGAMLYVVFGEIIPQSIILVKSRAATIVTLLGIITGLVVAQL
ncbi:MAG: ZIP family metal transporter [Oscillospiraceae bacterium]|nr:ZIP family metal transporter [Oscillospiraceae bacterium]